MSKHTRKARAAAARPGSIAANPKINIRNKVSVGATFDDDNPKSLYGERLIDPADVFTADELAEMPLVIRMTKTGERVKIWRDARGEWFREAGILRIQKQADGHHGYVIILDRGATESDLKKLLKIVQDARAGSTERHWQQLLEMAGADEKTLTHRFLSMSYVDPYVHADNSPLVTVCDEPRCVKKWHAGEGSVHTLDSAEDSSERIDYQITVQKDVDDQAGLGWYVNVHVPEFYGRPEDVASLVVDLQWMQEACRRANQPNPEATGGEVRAEVTA